MRLKGNNLEDNGMYKTVLRIYSWTPFEL
jgi:hypothetical protein